MWTGVKEVVQRDADKKFWQSGCPDEWVDNPLDATDIQNLKRFKNGSTFGEGHRVVGVSLKGTITGTKIYME